jgi:hypothetical protein
MYVVQYYLPGLFGFTINSETINILDILVGLLDGISDVPIQDKHSLRHGNIGAEQDRIAATGIDWACI